MCSTGVVRAWGVLGGRVKVLYTSFPSPREELPRFYRRDARRSSNPRGRETLRTCRRQSKCQRSQQQVEQDTGKGGGIGLLERRFLEKREIRRELANSRAARPLMNVVDLESALQTT